MSLQGPCSTTYPSLYASISQQCAIARQPMLVACMPGVPDIDTDQKIWHVGSVKFAIMLTTPTPAVVMHVA